MYLLAGCLYSAASLKLPINLKVLIPLCENMPSGTATKPGDVVTAKNGKTIQIDNTDAEGRLILADGTYSQSTFTAYVFCLYVFCLNTICHYSSYLRGYVQAQPRH